MSLVRIAAITGAARGIGRAIALRLADDGLDVVVNDLPSQAKELDRLVADIHAKNRRSLAVVGDVTRESDVQKLVSTAANDLGALDVMVANAGIASSTPLVETSVEEWDRIQAVNARGVFLCYKAAAIQMIKQGRGGRIIGAASTAAKQGAAHWGPYCASKFAIRGLTQCAAAEWGPQGITVNAYAPGFTDTTLINSVHESRKKHNLDPFVFPDNMLLSPVDVAGLVSYLVRTESKFVTGQSILINGGLFYD